MILGVPFQLRIFCESVKLPLCVFLIAVQNTSWKEGNCTCKSLHLTLTFHAVRRPHHSHVCEKAHPLLSPSVVMKFGMNIQKQLLLFPIQHIEKMLEVLLQAGYISLYSSAYSTAGGEWCNKILCRQIKQHSQESQQMPKQASYGLAL